MSTSVADVSALLTNANGTVNQVPAVPAPSETESFTNFMNASAEKTETKEDVKETVKQTKTVVEKPGRKDLEQTTGEKPETDNIDKDPIDAVSEAVNEIKEAIRDKFSISDEELAAVMETLNMTMTDLLNPDLLKDLMVTLNGQEDLVSALTDETLYTDIKEIVNLANNLTDEIKESFNLNEEDFAKLIEDVKTVQNEIEAPVVNEPDVQDRPKVPEIRVEINRSEEVRTADPVSEAPQQVISADRTQSASKEMTREDSEDASAQTAQPQQTQTQTQTVQVGDVVETVRTFSSYTNGQEIVRQVTDFIRVNISPEETSMELQLHPASLGTIHMNIATQNGIVTAQLLVQSESVKEALESQLMQLQETFEEQGTKVEAVEVAVASYDLDRGPFQDRDDRQDRQNADEQRGRRRVNLNLNDLNADDLELSEEDQLAKDVMEMNGTSVDFSA